MTLEERVFLTSKKLKCLVCAGQSVDASETSMAKDVRSYIQLQFEQGKTEQNVLDTMVEKYGTGILVNAPVAPSSLPLWGGPIILCGVAAFLLIRFLRRK